MTVVNLPNERWSTAEKRHFEFLHHLGRCALTGRTDGIEVAHIRIHAGMALKPNWRHTLPLHHLVHAAQERAGTDWWGELGFDLGTAQDPRHWAGVIALASEARDWGEAEALLFDMRRRANKSILREILKGGAS